MSGTKLYMNLDEGLQQVDVWKKQKDTIIFTNGCFDIFHAGHAMYLEEAKQLGQRLVVGINTDESVKKLKGEHRPILTLNDRASVLCALQAVDMVIPFAEDTPIELIRSLMPDVLVKGGDYNIEQMIGKDLVEKTGGEVKILSFKNDISTSTIIKRIQQSHHED